MAYLWHQKITDGSKHTEVKKSSYMWLLVTKLALSTTQPRRISKLIDIATSHLKPTESQSYD